MRGMLAVVFVLTWAGAAIAQPPPPLGPLQAGPPAQEAEIEGQVVSMEGSIIFVREEGTDLIWRCDTSRNFLMPGGFQVMTMRDPVTVEITGTETVSNLRAGMGLQFSVKLQNKRAVDEIAEATLFMPNPAIKLGILESAPIDSGDEPNTDKKGKPIVQETCLIAATIAKPYNKNGTLTVSYPSEKGSPQTLILRMPIDATITIADDNLSLVRAGDRIKAAGAGWVPQHFLARNIKIEHTPLVDEELAKKGFIPKKFKPMEQAKKERAPFELGDPEDKKPAALPVKAKVRLELLKVN